MFSLKYRSNISKKVVEEKGDKRWGKEILYCLKIAKEYQLLSQ